MGRVTCKVEGGGKVGGTVGVEIGMYLYGGSTGEGRGGGVVGVCAGSVSGVTWTERRPVGVQR